MTHDSIKQEILLDDNRILAFVEYGDLNGKPVFYFHGFPGSRLEANIVHNKAKESGIRVIAIDRPGMGYSSFSPDRQILDLPSDVVQLTNHLSIEKFGVVGVSTGGAYALACAYQIPRKLSVVCTVSLLGAVDFHKQCLRKDLRFFFRIASRSSLLFKSIFWYKRSRFLRDPRLCEKLCRSIKKGMALKDNELLEDEVFKNKVFASQSEACRQGLRGLKYEGKLVGKSWNIPFNKISSKVNIFLWHGEADTLSPVSATKELAAKIPAAVAKTFPEEGHYSVAYNHADEILGTLKKHMN